MGEEFEKFNLENAFIIRDDGTCVPFLGITEVHLSDDADQNDIDPDAVYARFQDMLGPITIEFDMKRRDYRKALKFFKKQANIYNRWVRYCKRQKERARRKALKG